MPAEANGVKKEKKWIKLWLGFLTSPTFFKWDDREVFCYIKMIALSATAKEEGTLDATMDNDFLAWRFRYDISIIKSTKKRLITPTLDPVTKEKEVMGIELSDGRFKLVNYYKHQSDWGRIKKYYEGKPRTPAPKKPANEEETELFKLWNSAGCMKHASIDEHLSRIRKTLTKYPIAKIKQAITNYGKIYGSKEWWYNHAWRLKDFLSRGMEPFFNENKPFEKYKKGGQQQKQELDRGTQELLAKAERDKKK